MHDPHPGVVLPRGAIELRCDSRTAGRVARAVLARQLRGWTGVVAVGTSSALGAIVSIGEGSWAVGLCYGLVTLALQAGWVAWTARRATRRAVSPGQPLVSRYEPSGFLSVSTGVGSNTFAAGSADRAVRSSGVVHLRLLPSRQWAILPGDLFTDDDLAFLSGRRGATPVVTPGELPLLHVVTPESRRALQQAAIAHVWRGRQGRFVLGALVVGGVSTALLPDRVTLSLLGLLVLTAAVLSAEAASRVGRHHPNGLLLRAAVTPAALLVEDREGRSAVPWSSFRSCTITRGGVLLTLTTGATMGLPQGLIPQAELARLELLVRQHGAA